MSKGKKYDLKLSEAGGEWTAELQRRVTARETKITKSQAGFSSEAEASEWGQAELAALMKVQAEKNKQHERSEKPTKKDRAE